MSAFINTCCQREKLWYALLMMANKPETAVRSSPSFFSWHHMFFSTWRWNFVRITSFPWQLHVYMTTTYCSNSPRHFSSNLLTVARMKMKLCVHASYIICMTISCFHDDILFEQPQIAWGTLHSSNLLMVGLMEMKLGTHAYDIVSMTTTYYLNNNK